jgi:cyclophilin family peptidyl-prolyl cis-trans isomerase
VTLLLLVLGCGGQKQVQPVKPAADTVAQEVEPTPAITETAATPAATQAETPAPEKKGMLKDTLVVGKLPENLFLTIKVKDYGTMKIRFFTKEAPKNVANVANLAIKGFYNGLVFHRLIPGFMIQGGDPSGDGTGGPGYTVPAEFSSRKHLKGTMAMARQGDQVNPKKASSGSQFYICFVPTPFLDNNYTTIGEMVDGIPVLEKLEKVPTGAQDRPTKPVVMEQVYVTTD